MHAFFVEGFSSNTLNFAKLCQTWLNLPKLGKLGHFFMFLSVFLCFCQLLSVLSIYVCFCPFLSVSVSFCLLMSVSVHFCPFLSVSVCFCHFRSVFFSFFFCMFFPLLLVFVPKRRQIIIRLVETSTCCHQAATLNRLQKLSPSL